ncbi:MAG: hypothetical protein JXA03_13925 [Bacteroidales bacterium]|nr:hypothetical protein [Bacteroidales bacterium]
MERIDDIAKTNAELFIYRHFSQLPERDTIVAHMRESVREIIKNALITYEHSKIR